jgi:hypothetical protein
MFSIKVHAIESLIKTKKIVSSHDQFCSHKYFCKLESIFFFSFDLRNVFWNGKLVHEIKTILKSLKNFRSHEQFFRHAQVPSRSGGELLEMRLLDKKWNRSFFYLPYVYQYLT